MWELRTKEYSEIFNLERGEIFEEVVVSKNYLIAEIIYAITIG